MDKSYECTGIDCMVHYLKNYDPPGCVRIKCTLYEGPTQVRDKDGFPC